MASSRAATVDDYLQELPDERRAVVAKVRALVRRRLPKGYKEGMQYGMITYCVPASTLAETHNGQPLCCIGLAAQKNHYALYLTGPYADGAQRAALEDGFAAAGKKLDMGQSCLRFRSLDDIALNPVGDAIASMSVDEFVSFYLAAREKTAKGSRSAKSAKKAATRKPRARG